MFFFIIRNRYVFLSDILDYTCQQKAFESSYLVHNVRFHMKWKLNGIAFYLFFLCVRCRETENERIEDFSCNKCVCLQKVPFFHP